MSIIVAASASADQPNIVYILADDMEHDSGESTNLQAQHPEQVEALGRLLGEFIARGRSTPGADRKHPEVKRWTQLDAIRRYLKDSTNTGEPHKDRS